MLRGYMGRILEIDLSEKKVNIDQLNEKWVKKFIGGSGLGAKLLYELTDETTDALSEENPLIFMTGPFTGTMIPNSGRHSAIAKSPLTGIWGESNVGGSWGTEFKSAGFDGLILHGKSEKPVYIWIENDQVRIEDAQELWNMDTLETATALNESTDREAVVTCIGPAGENKVLLSCIMTDGVDSRALGRCGLGAVMGAKKVKAIVVKGNNKVPVDKPDLLKELIRQKTRSIVKSTESLKKYGTSGGVENYDEMMNFPAKNWYQKRWPEGAKKINGVKMEETILSGRYYCKGCIIGCGREIEINEGPYAGIKGSGPEYETLGTLGGLCLIDDLEALAKANDLCNRYGLDTISTGGVIAFGMEAYEKGVISKDQCGGIELTWGNPEALISMIEAIAHKENEVAKLLGQGVKIASALLGQGSEEFAIHVKGLEFPAHDPRAFNGLALSYATSNRGACHLQGFTHPFELSLDMPELGIDQPHQRHQIEGKGALVANLQDLMCLFDSLQLCKFILVGGVKLTAITEWYNAVTGEDLSNSDMMHTGERLYNLKRLYNIRCGISRKDDTLPPRVLTHTRGPNLPHIGRMLHDYYDYRNWNERGIPTHEKLIELGLEDEVKRMGNYYSS